MKEVKRKSKKRHSKDQVTEENTIYQKLPNQNETQDPEHLCTVSPNIPQQDVDKYSTTLVVSYEFWRESFRCSASVRRESLSFLDIIDLRSLYIHPDGH